MGCALSLEEIDLLGEGSKKLSTTLLFLALANSLVSQDTKKEFDRSPQNIGSVLVFAGTGWYRHPEVAVAISGWLARRSSELQMQVDVSENPKDLLKILQKYQGACASIITRS